MKDIFLALLGLIFFVSEGLFAQVRLVSDYPMDDCSLTDVISGLDGTYVGADPCTCGAISNGLNFDGPDSEASLDRGINDILSENWTITFYVLPENTGDEVVDLFFLGNSCGRDSLFSVKYFSSSGRFRARLSDSPNNEAEVDGVSDPNTCWQYVAIVKSGPTLAMFINGEFTEQNSATSNLSLNVESSLQISNSPCQFSAINPDSPFRGSIDELRFYDGPLTQSEIQSQNLRPDQILTNDTTIFVGGSVLLRHGGTCSDDFSWNPTSTLSDPFRLDPVASPTETTTYELDINLPGCQIQDEVTIRVIDPEEITCDDLHLPNAFTPNGDRVNDSYGISNPFLIEELGKFEIFNRWGGRVYITFRAGDMWDGMYQGEMAAASSYVYFVQYTCNGEEFQKTGTLNLIR